MLPLPRYTKVYRLYGRYIHTYIAMTGLVTFTSRMVHTHLIPENLSMNWTLRCIAGQYTEHSVLYVVSIGLHFLGAQLPYPSSLAKVSSSTGGDRKMAPDKAEEKRRSRARTSQRKICSGPGTVLFSKVHPCECTVLYWHCSPVPAAEYQ